MAQTIVVNENEDDVILDLPLETKAEPVLEPIIEYEDIGSFGSIIKLYEGRIEWRIKSRYKDFHSMTLPEGVAEYARKRLLKEGFLEDVESDRRFKERVSGAKGFWKWTYFFSEIPEWNYNHILRLNHEGESKTLKFNGLPPRRYRDLIYELINLTGQSHYF